jgi:DNA-binding ferritin-like protein (Dps family)
MKKKKLLEKIKEAKRKSEWKLYKKLTDKLHRDYKVKPGDTIRGIPRGE